MSVSDKLIRHDRTLKREAEGLVLLMQVGAFMQVMDADARILSGLTGLKRQMAGAVDDPVVVGGFPKRGVDQTLGKLARARHSVAIAWQDQDKARLISERILVTAAPRGTAIRRRLPSGSRLADRGRRHGWSGARVRSWRWQTGPGWGGQQTPRPH